MNVLKLDLIHLLYHFQRICFRVKQRVFGLGSWCFKSNFYGGIFFIIIIGSFSGCKQQNSTLSDEFYVRHKNAEMPVYIYGNSDEKVFIIYLHGGPGGNGLEYRSEVMRTRVEPEYAIVYWDQRHAGMSQGSFSEADLTMDLMVEDVMAVVEVVKFKYGNDCKFFLMGHSWGGALGVATLIKGANQDEFLGWIEIDGAHDLANAHVENHRYMKKVCNEQLYLGNSIDFWTGVKDRLGSIDSLEYDPDGSYYLNTTAFEAEQYLLEDGVLSNYDYTLGGLLNDLIAVSLINNPLTSYVNGNVGNYILDEYGIWESLSYTNEIALIDIPCLFMWGKYDMVVPPTLGEKAFELCTATDKEFVLFEESGHSPMDQEAVKFSESILGFVGKHK